MRIVLASALTVLGLTVAACSSGPDTKAATKKYADKVCACKTYECARPVFREYLAWLDKHPSKEQAPPELDRLMSCAKATGAM
ncbi:MAG: hypothetical protein KA297_30945 [Kofleriaceae bacterium]|jgi:hypothetical protein|nr:hypothetical protein [Kofleriaceae bacterium]